jgi:hypothetical protein
MPRRETKTLRARNRLLNELLNNKAKGGGKHVPKEDKRVKTKERNDLDKELLGLTRE